MTVGNPLDLPSSPGLVDTHCHLGVLEAAGTLQQALDEAWASGMAGIIAVGLNLEDSLRCASIAEQEANVFFSVGWHPTEPAAPDPAEVRELEALLTHPKAVAVGEIGLDYYWRAGYHEVPSGIQKRSLAVLCELASGHDKPLLLHVRDAQDEIFAALGDGVEERGGIMHCFSGGKAHMQASLRHNFAISFAGPVTFRPNRELRELAGEVPADMYVVETDSPYLSPHPLRGRPNTPARVAITASTVAEARGISLADVCTESTANARRILRLDKWVKPVG